MGVHDAYRRSHVCEGSSSATLGLSPFLDV